MGPVARTDKALTAVLIDDHGLFAQGLQLLLNTASGDWVRVVARSERAEDAEDLVRRYRPDVAIVDLAMPPPGGVHAIKKLATRYPDVAILALSGVEDINIILSALQAGARGFLPKASNPDVIIPPLLAVAAGWSVLPPQVLSTAVNRLERRRAALLDSLDTDDRELWRLVATGAESADIAGRLNVSERTAKRMVASLLRRLRASNRVEAAALAGMSGLLDEDQAD